MKKTIDTNLQQAFAISPEGVRLCPRGPCRRARWRFCLKSRGKPPSSGIAIEEA